MKKLLISTMATGYYCDYAPLWEYCIKKSYPEYDFVVTLNKSEAPKYFAACGRLLFQITQHEYTYITDIDMMILREDPTLLDFHLEEIKSDGLCYSNSRRRKEHLGSKRLTGLHFVTREWYDKTVVSREKYKIMLEEGLIGSGRFDDELMLMQICNESGLGISPHRQLVPRHHGIHFGTIRAYINHTYTRLRQQLMMRVKPDQATQWIGFYNDKEFVEIITKTGKKNRTIKKELDVLYAFCRGLLNAGK